MRAPGPAAAPRTWPSRRLQRGLTWTQPIRQAAQPPKRQTRRVAAARPAQPRQERHICIQKHGPRAGQGGLHAPRRLRGRPPEEAGQRPRHLRVRHPVDSRAGARARAVGRPEREPHAFKMRVWSCAHPVKILAKFGADTTVRAGRPRRSRRSPVSIKKEKPWSGRRPS